MSEHNEHIEKGVESQKKIVMPAYIPGNDDSVSKEQFSFLLNEESAGPSIKRKQRLLEDIKRTIIALIYNPEKQVKGKYSGYLSEVLGYNYTYMANLFSEMNGYSIQNFIISTKIERVKELLAAQSMTLTEISYKMNYSSVAHLSNQFKKVTGVSPSTYLETLTQSSHSRASNINSVMH